MTFCRLSVAAGLLALTLSAQAEITNLICTQTAPGEYSLSYTLTGDSTTVAIAASADPSGKGQQAVLKTSEGKVTVHAGKPDERMYFFLKPDHGEEREVSIRHLPLEGSANFRDLGGYETKDGRFVKWGQLYRSGVLSYLTPTDLHYLSDLGIRVVCDFRTQQENNAAPEKWVDDEKVQHVSLPIGTDASGKSVSMQSVLAGNPTPEQLRAWMMKTYSDFAFRGAPEFAKVFTQLKDDRLPLLYHCSAGKDRTGVFSALLLLTLGVPEDTVLADYALTTNFLQADSAANRKMMASAGAASVSQLSPEQRKVLMAADPEYLRSTLRSIDARYGSFDNYRRQVLQVSDSDVKKLQARLLMK